MHDVNNDDCDNDNASRDGSVLSLSSAQERMKALETITKKRRGVASRRTIAKSATTRLPNPYRPRRLSPCVCAEWAVNFVPEA